MLRMRTLSSATYLISLGLTHSSAQPKAKKMGLYKCARQVAHAAEEAKNEAENALKFLTEEAWPEMQKTLEEMRDTVTFAAHMVVLLVALYVCIYASLKIRELILSSGVPAFVKTIVNGMCLGFLLIVFTLIFIMIFHLFLEMDLYDYTVVFIKEFWNCTVYNNYY